MAFKFPGFSTIVKNVTGQASSAFGNALPGGPATGNNVFGSTVSALGSRAGTVIGGVIKQNILKLPNQLFGSLMGNKYLGPILNQVWGNFFSSQKPSLQAMERRPDPAFSFMWAISLPVLENMGATDFNAPNMNEYIEEIDFGLMNIEVHTVNRPERDISYARRKTAPAVQITFYEDGTNRAATQYIEGWKSMMSYADGTFNYPLGDGQVQGYKQKITVGVNASDGSSAGFYVLIGCFPSGGAQISKTSGSSDRIRLVQQFSCDHVLFVPIGGQSGGTVNVGDLQQVALGGLAQNLFGGGG